MDPNTIQDLLQQDWLSPQGAMLLAGISYAWLRLLGERGQIKVLDTPLGRLYNRADVERVRTERARRGGRAEEPPVPASGRTHQRT
jgi:hypothetical protein